MLFGTFQQLLHVVIQQIALSLQQIYPAERCIRALLFDLVVRIDGRLYKTNQTKSMHALSS